MTPERWARVKQLYHEALACSANQRDSFLADACAGDDVLRGEVESLLAHDGGAAFLSIPAMATRMGEGIRTGQMLGPCTISAQIGEGGMGEVYRARDTKLNRDVALKILPSAFAVDPDRLARFKREAHVLAALNHPHIAAIYGFEESTGVQALVLELVEGPTLADRLARGPIPLDEVLPIAAQIAQALEAAHEQGIIHRDLKPANIKLRPDGAVKVLDFGLAKALEPAAGMAAGMTASPTLTTPAMTALGVVLGTAAYMSPEQARGKPLDKRTDIWSFGCVLYEMLTGRPAFPGDTISDTIAAILGDDPDWGRLSRETSDNVRRLLQRCLEKDPKQRLHDIADAGIEIHDAQSKAHSAVIASPVPVVTRRGRERLAWTVAGLLAMVSVVAVAVAIAVTLRPTPAAREVRLEITTPPTTDQVSLALSPDGEKLVFAAESEGQPRLWLRSLEAGSAHPLPGTDRGAYPFWSPDSRSIGFFAEGKLKRLDIAGGPAQPLADASIGRGGTWSRNGVILFAPGTFSRIFRVSDRGGEPVAVTGGEMPKAVGYRFPQFLPNGRHFLFSVVGAAQDRGVYVASLDGSVKRRLVDADTAVVLASGHLLFVRQGALFVQSFDPVRLELAGNPFPVAEDILFSGAVNISVLSSSDAGSIVYRTRAASDQRQFLWFDRSGKEMGRVGEPRFAEILTVSNFSGRGPAAVGSHDGLGPFGTYDMAGNVKEWCATETDGRRFLLGGAWNEPKYMFATDDAKGPFERAPGYGFRVAKYIRPLPPAVTAPVRIAGPGRGARKQQAVGDDIFAVYRRQYAYDRAPLNAVIESTEETEIWLKHTVVFDTAYGDERMRAHLFLPKNGSPPYQTVVFFPAADAFHLQTTRDMSLAWGNFIIGSGRAVLYPVYKGTYELHRGRCPEAA